MNISKVFIWSQKSLINAYVKIYVCPDTKKENFFKGTNS